MAEVAVRVQASLDAGVRLRLEREGARVIVTGPPRTGKSTIAAAAAAHAGARLRKTDDLIGELDWGDDSEEVARWFDETDAPWVIEGVSSVRALRKWFVAHPEREDRPADIVVWCESPRVRRTPGQESLAKGTQKIWKAVVLELLKRGVPVVHG